MTIIIRDKSDQTISIRDLQRKVVRRFKAIILEFFVYILHGVGNIPFHHIRRCIYRISGMKIGKGSSLHMGIRLYNPKNIFIGNDSIIGENSILDGRDVLSIGNHVALASEVMIYNSEHDINSPSFSPVTGKVIIEDYVFIGPRVIILPGVTVGRGAVVAAGAVVTKNVPSFSIVGGVPSKEIGRRDDKCIGYRLGRASWFR